MRLSVIISILAFAVGCGGAGAPDEAAKNGQVGENSPSEAKKEEAQKEEKKEAKKEPAKPKAEPENRKSLELLSVRGPAEAKGLRSERSGMYQEFRSLQDDHRKAVAPLIDKLQYFQWSSKPEDMQAAPEKIMGFIKECLRIAGEYKVLGEASHAKLTQWETEIEQGKKRHKESKVEDLKAKRNSEMKVYRSLHLLVRSLLDEAIIYGRFGSWAMQDSMKAAYLEMKEPLKADERVAGTYDTLLMVLGVPAAER